MHRNFLIIPFEGWHLEVINLRQEQRELIEVQSQKVGGYSNFGDLFIHGGAVDDGGPCAWTGLLDGKVIVCAGVLHIDDYFGQAWSFVSEDFTKENLSVKMKCIKGIKNGLDRLPLRRIQADTETWFLEAQRFLRFLGFEKEGIMRSYTPVGDDSILYSRIKEI